MLGTGCADHRRPGRGRLAHARVHAQAGRGAAGHQLADQRDRRRRPPRGHPGRHAPVTDTAPPYADRHDETTTPTTTMATTHDTPPFGVGGRRDRSERAGTPPLRAARRADPAGTAPSKSGTGSSSSTTCAAAASSPRRSSPPRRASCSTALSPRDPASALCNPGALRRPVGGWRHPTERGPMHAQVVTSISPMRKPPSRSLEELIPREGSPGSWPATGSASTTRTGRPSPSSRPRTSPAGTAGRRRHGRRQVTSSGRRGDRQRLRPERPARGLPWAR